jgi:hypothetical protein
VDPKCAPRRRIRSAFPSAVAGAAVLLSILAAGVADAAPPRPHDLRNARLVLTAVDGVEFRVDGRRLRDGPSQRSVWLSPGRHRLTATWHRCEGSPVVRKEIALQPGRTAAWSFAEPEGCLVTAEYRARDAVAYARQEAAENSLGHVQVSSDVPVLIVIDRTLMAPAGAYGYLVRAGTHDLGIVPVAPEDGDRVELVVEVAARETTRVRYEFRAGRP